MKLQIDRHTEVTYTRHVADPSVIPTGGCTYMLLTPPVRCRQVVDPPRPRRPHHGAACWPVRRTDWWLYLHVADPSSSMSTSGWPTKATASTSWCSLLTCPSYRLVIVLTCSWPLQLDVDQWLTHQGHGVHLMMQLADPSVISTGDRYRRLVTLDFTYRIKLLHMVTKIYKPKTDHEINLLRYFQNTSYEPCGPYLLKRITYANKKCL